MIKRINNKVDSFRCGDCYVSIVPGAKGKYQIMKSYGSNGNFPASLNYGFDFWADIEPFDSFVKACIFLKNNVKDIL